MTRTVPDTKLEELLTPVTEALDKGARESGTDILQMALGAATRSLIRDIVKEASKDIVREVNLWQKDLPPLKIHVGELPIQDWGEITHPKLQDVIACLAAGQNVLLVGPAGSGKSHLAAQAAKALGITFRGYVSCTNGTSESAFLGQLIPAEGGGFRYYSTPFVDTCREGGLVCIDEVDAGDSNTMLCLNAALSGQPLFIPKRYSDPVQAISPDGKIVATANTYGLGSDRVYAGRNQLDGAFLDRWVQIDVGYDPNLEKHFCPDDDLRAKLVKIREAIEANKMRRHITGRSLRRAYVQRHACKWDDQKILVHATLGWTRDEKKLAGLA